MLRKGIFLVTLLCLLMLTLGLVVYDWGGPARGSTNPTNTTSQPDTTTPNVSNNLDVGNQRFFNDSIVPLLTAHCIECHGPEEQEGSFRADHLVADINDATDFQVWAKVREMVRTGEMPPEEQPRLSGGEVKKLEAWIAKGLKAYGLRDRYESVGRPPERANQIPNDLLFHSSESNPPPATPARKWRISSWIYRNLMYELHIGNAHSLDQTEVLKNYDESPFSGNGAVFKYYHEGSGTDQSLMNLVIENAITLTARRTTWATDSESGAVRYDPKTGHPVPIEPAFACYMPLVNPKAAPTQKDMEFAIKKTFLDVLLRDPTTSEQSKYLELMQRSVKKLGQLEGSRTALAAILLMPEIYFRSEWGQGPADAHGRRLLGPMELAFAIAYALTDRRPDALLLKAARSGKLANRAAVRKQVLRILSDSKIAKPRILRFIQEYFDYPKAAALFKDQKTVAVFRKKMAVELYPDNDGLPKGGLRFTYDPGSLVRDTDRLVEFILKKDQHVLEELLTTNLSFVAFEDAGRSGSHLVYNLEEWPKDARQPIALPKAQRAGILTQPSWLVAHSKDFHNDPIRRGKWIRERLLAGRLLGQLPVVPPFPVDPEKTLRQRLAFTRKAECWMCHSKMDPLGLPFEAYNHFGRHRTTDVGEEVPTEGLEGSHLTRDLGPVDTSGALDGTGDASLDGPVKNPIELIRKLSRSTYVRQVFIRHAFRYWMGRAETLLDAPVLIEAERAYVESEGSMQALITSLLTSDAYLYRVAARPGSKSAGKGPRP